MRTLIAILLATGCGSSHATDTTIDASPYDTLPAAACSVDGITGTIAGVSLSIHADSCVIKRGTGTHVTYTVTTTAAVPPITTPDSGGGCGACKSWGPDPISFTGYYIGAADPNSQAHYCLCDVGCCAPTQSRQVQVDATTSSASFDWSGRTWDGASDTGNPMGDFFPVGHYNVRVTFAGFDAGQVEAALPIQIVP